MASKDSGEPNNSNDRLKTTQMLLNEQLQNITDSAISAQTISDSLKGTKSVYNQYADKIGISKKLVGLIEN